MLVPSPFALSEVEGYAPHAGASTSLSMNEGV